MNKIIVILGLLLVLMMGVVSANVYDTFESYQDGFMQEETYGLWTCLDGQTPLDSGCKVWNTTDYLSGNRYLSVGTDHVAHRSVSPQIDTGVVRFSFLMDGAGTNIGIGGGVFPSVLLVGSNYDLNATSENVKNNGSEIFGGFRLGMRSYWTGQPVTVLDAYYVYDAEIDGWVVFTPNVVVGDATLPDWAFYDGSYTGVNIVNASFEMVLDLDADTITYNFRDLNGDIIGQHDDVFDISSLDTVDVEDMLVECTENGIGTYCGASVDDISYSYGNSVPVVSNIQINPSNPELSDNLICSYDFSDADGDSDFSSVSWFVNDVLVSSTQALGSGSFDTDDYVVCSVTANDGADNGNTISQTLLVGYGIIGDSTSFDASLSLIDELLIESTEIKDIDVNGDASLMFYVGYEYLNLGNVLGVVSLSPDSFGGSNTVDVGSFGSLEPVSVDEIDGTVWLSGYNFVERIDYVYSPLSLSTASNKTYQKTGLTTVYRDIVGSPLIDEAGYYNTVAFACRVDLTGSENVDGVEVFQLNTSSGELYSKFVVDTNGCRGLDIQDNYLYVDRGLDVAIFEIDSSHNLTQVSSFGNRSYFSTGSQWGRTDMTNVLNDVLVTVDSSAGVPESLYGVDISSKASPVASSYTCDLLSGGSDVMNLELLNSSYVILTDDSDSGIYGCNLAEDGDAVLLWDNPYVPSSDSTGFGYKMVHYTDGQSDFFYTHDINGYLRIFKYVPQGFSVDTNLLPYFSSTTPDTQYVDNLNPIANGVNVTGLETPVVNVYPLTCRSPNLYDCAIDSEGDDVLFAVDDDYAGSLTSPSWWSYQGYSTSYDSAGLKTMRIYITDSEHPDVYTVYKDIVINVSGTGTPLPENYSTLRFHVYDAVTGYDVESVYVNVVDSGVTDGYTNSVGNFQTVALEGVYSVDFTKEGYIYQAHNYGTSSVVQEVELSPVAEANRRTLILTIKDSEGVVIPNVFVQIQMPVLVDFDFAYTDSNGRVVFYPTDDNVLVDIDEDGWGYARVEVSVPLGSTVNKDILLTSSGVVVNQGAFDVTGCQDYIEGVLLCDYDKTPCSIDTDCALTGRCDTNGRCSNFNWSLCDAQGTARDNRCFLRNTATGSLSSVGDWVIENFFYVLIIVLVLIGALILSLRRGS